MCLILEAYVGAAVVHLALRSVSEFKLAHCRHLRFPEQYLLCRLVRSKMFIP